MFFKLDVSQCYVKSKFLGQAAERIEEQREEKDWFSVHIIL